MLVDFAVFDAQVYLSLGCMNPVVESPQQAVGVALDASLEATVCVRHEFLRVCLQIAVRVAHQPEASWFADEHALVKDLHGARENQSVGKNGPLVHHAVMVGIFEYGDIADRIEVRLFGLKITHEPGHLDDPQSSGEIPVNRRWIVHQRFAGDELEVIAWRHVEGLERVGRR
jgi:hypothetical protein